ncbi:MAG: hypothetical protein ACREN7_02105 [Candidatus Dormibacteria bacterium]
MARMSLGAAYLNPYELTALQIAGAQLQGAFRSRHRPSPQERLASSDRLLDQVERSRLNAQAAISAPVFDRVAELARSVDPRLRGALGSSRDPDHVGGILFQVQARLMWAAREERSRGLAPVIPLFPSTP